MSTIVSSLASQMTSTSREESHEYTAAQIVAQWLNIVIVVAAAALNTKASMLWSESRILRKLKARNPYHLRQSVMSKQHDHVFIELYVSLSKGRRRTYSRLYPFLYYLFAFSIDIVDISEFCFRGFAPNIFASEALTALRLLIYFGSFACFGAITLTFVQYALLFFSVSALASFHIILGYGLWELTSEVRRGFAICQLVSIFLFFFIHALGWTTDRTSLSDIASVMSSTREESFGSRCFETVNLRNNLTKAQRSRLEQMEHFAMEYTNFDEIRSRQVVPGRWYEVRDIFFFLLISGSSAFTWGALDKDSIPRIVFLDCLEAISVFLLYINETTIENVLFVKLLQIANISED